MSTTIGFSAGFASGAGPGNARRTHNRAWAIAEMVSAVRTKPAKPQIQNKRSQFLTGHFPDDMPSARHHALTSPDRASFSRGCDRFAAIGLDGLKCRAVPAKG